MRVHDRNGVEVQLTRLHDAATFANVIEGDLQEVSEMIVGNVLRADRDTEDDSPRILLNASERRTLRGRSVLPPRICTARLARGAEALTVVWFQDCGDSFAQLRAYLGLASWAQWTTLVSPARLEGSSPQPPPPVPPLRDIDEFPIELDVLDWGVFPRTETAPLDATEFQYHFLQTSDRAWKMGGGHRLLITPEFRNRTRAGFPVEGVVASLCSDWTSDPEDFLTHLTVFWAQNRSNPFERLAELCRELEWKKDSFGWQP